MLTSGKAALQFGNFAVLKKLEYYLLITIP